MKWNGKINGGATFTTSILNEVIYELIVFATSMYYLLLKWETNITHYQIKEHWRLDLEQPWTEGLCSSVSVNEAICKHAIEKQLADKLTFMFQFTLVWIFFFSTQWAAATILKGKTFDNM